jgi:hypothetical protein
VGHGFSNGFSSVLHPTELEPGFGQQRHACLHAREHHAVDPHRTTSEAGEVRVDRFGLALDALLEAGKRIHPSGIASVFVQRQRIGGVALLGLRQLVRSEQSTDVVE